MDLETDIINTNNKSEVNTDVNTDVNTNINDISSVTETLDSDDLGKIEDGFDQLNMVTIQKMIFIYNAINSGWTVRKIKENKYEFKKPKKKIIRNFKLDNYLKEFIRRSADIDTLKDI